MDPTIFMIGASQKGSDDGHIKHGFHGPLPPPRNLITPRDGPGFVASDSCHKNVVTGGEGLFLADLTMYDR